MRTRGLLVLLLLPTAAAAQSGSTAGVWWLPFPVVAGPHAFAIVRGEDYVPGQEVVLEIYATSDRPGAKEVFLGRSRTTVKGNGKFVLGLVSYGLPETRSEWKIKYWYSPRARDGEVNSPSEFTARREPPARK